MRTYDKDEISELNAEPWQIDLLKLNPGYVCWGPHEDYMMNEGGWSGRQIFDTWGEFGPWSLDDLNECVNFYFEVSRESKDCPACEGDGYHSEAKPIANTFYSHMNPKGESWNDKITQEEVAALMESRRLSDFTRNKPEGYVPTAEEVNAAQNGGGFMGHDAINRCILIDARLKRLGIPKNCCECDGNGYVHTAPSAHVSIVLWLLHPRKGCSRGVEVKNITQEDLPGVYEFLNEAAKRNAARFSKIPQLTTP